MTSLAGVKIGDILVTDKPVSITASRFKTIFRVTKINNKIIYYHVLRDFNHNGIFKYESDYGFDISDLEESGWYIMQNAYLDADGRIVTKAFCKWRRL